MCAQHGGDIVGFFRIGEKLLSRNKLNKIIDNILELRKSGLPQQEVAQRVGCDRSFISRLENLAEVRKGGSLAIIGFPLQNVEELQKVSSQFGVEYSLILNDKERWEILESYDGRKLLNWLMELLMDMSAYDHVIMIGSDMRIRLAETILGEKVVGLIIGESPIEEDIYLSPNMFRDLIVSIKGE